MTIRLSPVQETQPGVFNIKYETLHATTVVLKWFCFRTQMYSEWHTKIVYRTNVNKNVLKINPCTFLINDY